MFWKGKGWEEGGRCFVDKLLFIFIFPGRPWNINIHNSPSVFLRLKVKGDFCVCFCSVLCPSYNPKKTLYCTIKIYLLISLLYLTVIGLETDNMFFLPFYNHFKSLAYNIWKPENWFINEWSFDFRELWLILFHDSTDIVQLLSMRLDQIERDATGQKEGRLSVVILRWKHCTLEDLLWIHKAIIKEKDWEQQEKTKGTNQLTKITTKW